MNEEDRQIDHAYQSPDEEFLQSSNLIDPIDANQLSSNWLNTLYQDEYEFLTQDEFILLDFIGVNGLIRASNISMSFQGLKRLISLHQARLTKALNRLIKKDLLIKKDGGYSLTGEGLQLFNKLFGKFKRNINPTLPFIHVASGTIQGIDLQFTDLKSISDKLKGKWFSKYRFTSKTEYEDSIEICWFSTNGSVSASLRLGPDNQVRLSIATKFSRLMKSEISVLIDYISQLLESLIDAPVIFNNHAVYEDMIALKLQDDESIYFAG